MRKVIKIGIVDDHPIFRDCLKMMIETQNEMKVELEASDGFELLSFLEKGHSIDILLLDINMPNMDGKETCTKVKKAFPGIKILMLTMYNDVPYIQHLMKQGANGYVPKTAKWDELRKALHEVIEKDYYFSDLVSMAMLQNLKKPVENTSLMSEAPKLSKREKEVLLHICKGRSTQEMADLLFISQRTVEGHRANLLKHFNVKNAAALTVKALKYKFVSLSDL